MAWSSTQHQVIFIGDRFLFHAIEMHASYGKTWQIFSLATPPPLPTAGIIGKATVTLTVAQIIHRCVLELYTATLILHRRYMGRKYDMFGSNEAEHVAIDMVMEGVEVRRGGAASKAHAGVR